MVFTKAALRRIQKIHALSTQYNTSTRTPHLRKLLDLVREHADEIENLLKKNDRHGIIETGDLLVLCLEIILESGESPDEITEQCFGRYEKKLQRLLRERTRGKSARKRKGIQKRRLRA